MGRIEQRRQRQLRHQEALREWAIVALLVSLVALLYLPPELPIAGAKFTSWGFSRGLLRTGDAASGLALSPGRSMTNDSPGDAGPAFPVAQRSGWQISLDFGTYPAGNNRYFPHVLTVHNSSGWATAVHWYYSGAVASFIISDGQSAQMSPGSSVDLGFTLDSKPSDNAGEYVGTLHIVTDTGLVLAALPVRLRLAEPKRSSSPSGKGQGQGTMVAGHVEVSPDMVSTVVTTPDLQAQVSAPTQEGEGTNGPAGN